MLCRVQASRLWCASLSNLKSTSRCISNRALQLPATSVWETFTPLAMKHEAVNLGQGFPTFSPPSIITNATNEALKDGIVQYTRSAGHIRLVNALANYLSPSMGRELNPMEEILPTVGATEALLLSTLALLNPNDEAMLIEPFYDSYSGQVEIAGGKCVYVSLKHSGDSCVDANNRLPNASTWQLPLDEMQAKVTPKTKLLFFNNPANCPGKVYTREELEKVAKFAIDNDLIVIADEVYDLLTFDEQKHIRIASLPGMAERTITIGSAGKTFSVTGFKIGWAIACPKLINAMARVHIYVPFCCPSTLQEGVARALERMKDENYLEETRKYYDQKRKLLIEMLQSVNLPVIVPQGSYFALASASKIDPSRYIDSSSTDALDWQFCKWLTTVGGVCAIPPSAFYSTPPKDVFARFAFCKNDQQMEEAGKRLKALGL